MKPVFGIVMSHAPGISAFWEMMPLERRAPLDAAYEQLRAELRRLAPDVIVAFVNDHFRSFTLAAMPAFCVGLGVEHAIPMKGGSEILRVPERRFKGDPELASFLLQSLFDDGFDPAFSGELQFFDDLAVPLHYLYPGPETPDVAIVPIMTNCIAPPLPSMRRCHQLGAAVGRALERFGGKPRRIAILGTGGLSHWVGMPRNGDLNEEFDHRVLDLVGAGRELEMLGWTDAQIEGEAGNGALELRNWVEAFGAMGEYRARPLAYVPAPEWITGIAAVALDPVAAGSPVRERERAAARS